MKKGSVSRFSTAALAPALALAFLIFLPALVGAKAPSALDGFNPNADNLVRAFAIQPDGKILVGGWFTLIDTKPCNRIARLNPDGSVDATFNPGTGANDKVGALALQPDGKVLLAGDFTAINGTPRNRIARLNADGSLDAAFNPGKGANDTIRDLALLSSGKVLLAGTFTSIDGTARNGIARLNANGSLDTTFNPGKGANGTVYALKVQADGKILLGGGFTSFNGLSRNKIARLNANGSLDTSFNARTGANVGVSALAIQPDGKILLGGWFWNVSGSLFSHVARLNADGSLDTTFNPGKGANAPVRTLALQSDGKILLGGEFTKIDDTARNHIARLNPNGSLDTAFDLGAGPDKDVYTLMVQPDGKILMGGSFGQVNGETHWFMARLYAGGSLDMTFDPGITAGKGADILAVQPDGKILLAGNFSEISGVPINNIARLNPDGLLDPTFDPGSGADDWVASLAAQPDGKVLLAGNFTSFNDTARNRVARLNADGSLDLTFDPGMGANNEVLTMVLQKDGKVLLGGAFTSLNGADRKFIGQLNADGSLDTSFNPGTGPNGMVNTMVVQVDGKVLVSGDFTTITGTRCNHIARLNANGSLDKSFNNGTGLDDIAWSIVVQGDGKILLGGAFHTVNGTARNGIARLNADGSLDKSFDTGSGTTNAVDTIALQANGKVLLGGTFSAINGISQYHLSRLNADGSLDTMFSLGWFTNGEVRNLVLQADGKLVIGGYFNNVDSSIRLGIARLTNPDAARQEILVGDGGVSVTWMIGGSFPQPFQVFFEDSADGATWNKLGWGVYAPGVGYRLSGLRLPLKTNHYVRATGWVNDGWGSNSLHQSVLRFCAQ